MALINKIITNTNKNICFKYDFISVLIPPSSIGVFVWVVLSGVTNNFFNGFNNYINVGERFTKF